ncbi:MAG: hypothetical protein LBB94_01535 [Clostridiales bacterium]|nr:hypothetical protein [Clostridiales bacterium]
MKRILEKPITKMALMITFLLVPAAANAVAWLSQRHIETNNEHTATLYYEAFFQNQAQPQALHFSVNTDQLTPTPGLTPYTDYWGEESGVYMTVTTSETTKLTIVNKSNRETYVRIKIIPEWQTAGGSDDIPPVFAEPVHLGQLFDTNVFHVSSLTPEGGEPPPGTPQAEVFQAAYDQINRLQAGLGSNPVYSDGVDTSSQAFYIYLLEGLDFAVAAPPNLIHGDSYETRFEIELSEDDISRYLPVPVDAISLKLTFAVEAIQGTPQMLEYAQDPSNPGITVPWIYSPIKSASVLIPPSNYTPDNSDAPSYGLRQQEAVVKAANAHLGGILLADGGTVYTWGWNGHGQLGIGKDDLPLPAVGTPKESIKPAHWDAQTYGGGYTEVDFFTRPDRYSANYADLGIAPELTSPTEIVDVGAGYHHMLALDKRGRVWAWGYNTDRQIGKKGKSHYTFPQLVQGLPEDIIRIWGNNGYLNRGQSFALTGGGELWSWGSNLNGKHGVGTTENTASYQMTPHKVIFPQGTIITDVQGGDYHNIALDDRGDVWVWGYGLSGLLGDGKNKTYKTPEKLPRPDGMSEAVEISVSYGNNLILDSNHNVWQWGRVFIGPAAGNSTIVKTPRAVEAEPEEIQRIGYTPVAHGIGAGESVCYFIDQHGRSWAWGDGRYHGFGREGGYINALKIIARKAYQYPQIIGDGDTQVTDKDPKTPGDGAKKDSTYGTYGFNRLHPTVYDDKYAAASGEEAWKSLALQPIPKIKRIIGSRSSYIILDYDGNLFKWAYDGSGAMAWGYDFEKQYDRTGNGRDGLYDTYCYEVMPMRGGYFADAP